MYKFLLQNSILFLKYLKCRVFFWITLGKFVSYQYGTLPRFEDVLESKEYKGIKEKEYIKNGMVKILV